MTNRFRKAAWWVCLVWLGSATASAATPPDPQNGHWVILTVTPSVVLSGEKVEATATCRCGGATPCNLRWVDHAFLTPVATNNAAKIVASGIAPEVAIPAGRSVGIAEYRVSATCNGSSQAEIIDVFNGMRLRADPPMAPVSEMPNFHPFRIENNNYQSAGIKMSPRGGRLTFGMVNEDIDQGQTTSQNPDDPDQWTTTPGKGPYSTVFTVKNGTAFFAGNRPSITVDSLCPTNVYLTVPADKNAPGSTITVEAVVTDKAGDRPDSTTGLTAKDLRTISRTWSIVIAAEEQLYPTEVHADTSHPNAAREGQWRTTTGIYVYKAGPTNPAPRDRPNYYDGISVEEFFTPVGFDGTVTPASFNPAWRAYYAARGFIATKNGVEVVNDHLAQELNLMRNGSFDIHDDGRIVDINSFEGGEGFFNFIFTPATLAGTITFCWKQEFVCDRKNIGTFRIKNRLVNGAPSQLRERF